MNGPIPLPSHVHYELLLQLLEQQTLFSVYEDPDLKIEVNELIITLRKALSQQRKLEEDCERLGYKIDYRWSLNGQPAEE
jgi:Zn-finger domain-containing protein